MANSSIIGKAKNKIIREFIKDINIINAIGSENVKSIDGAEKLIGTHIFDYDQNPNTLDTVGTFITIQVHIPQSRYEIKSFVSPTIEIRIMSHEGHMVVDNIPKITENRNDYLSKLIDEKLNGRNDIGIGGIRLTSNIESSYQKNYICRQMIFTCTDLNDSLCEEE